MVYNGQYAVKALTFGETRDEVHCDLHERGHIFGDSDFVKWGAGFVHEVLVLLTHSTPLDILLHPGSCLGPEIVAIDLTNHLVPPLMSPSFVFMPHPQDFSLHLVVGWYHQLIAWDVLPHSSV